MKHKQIIGWREWIGLPDLGIDKIKAKVDTGARTSAIHAYHVEEFTRDGDLWVAFGLHPTQKDDTFEVQCEAKVKDIRGITSSNGETQKRHIIETTIDMSGDQWSIELSLTNRDQMGFRMLIGRAAVRGHCYVDAGTSYLANKHLYAEAEERKTNPPPLRRDR